MPLSLGCGKLSRTLVLVIACASLCLGGPTLVRWQTPFAAQCTDSDNLAGTQDTIPFEEQALALPTIRLTRQQEQGLAADCSFRLAAIVLLVPQAEARGDHAIIAQVSFIFPVDLNETTDPRAPYTIVTLPVKV